MFHVGGRVELRLGDFQLGSNSIVLVGMVAPVVQDRGLELEHQLAMTGVCPQDWHTSSK